MDPEAYAKYNKPEVGGKMGVYRAPNGEELWAENGPSADAMLRQGFVFVRELPSAQERRKAEGANAVGPASAREVTPEVNAEDEADQAEAERVAAKRRSDAKKESK